MNYLVQEKYIKYFTISVYFLTILQLIYYKREFNYAIFQLLWLGCLAIMVYSAYYLLSDQKIENRYFRIVFTLFLLYEGLTIFRGLLHNTNPNADELWFLISRTHILWPFIIPLMVFFTKDLSIYPTMFNWFYKFGLVFLGMCILVPEIITHRVAAEMVIISMVTGSGYFLMFSTYLDNRKVNFAFIVLLVGIIGFSILARRSGLFTLLAILISSYLLNYKSALKPMVFRYFPVFLTLIAILLISSSSIFSMLTSRLEQRLTEDSRSYVVEFFWLSLQDDLLLGKGLNGTYYCPIGGELEDEGVVFAELEFREVIENGYLQLILTGGLIHLLLFLLVLIPAAILGIFYSSNLFARASGVVVLLWLMDMLLFGVPMLKINYIFLWICVGICYKTSIRMKSDDEIRSSFQNRLTA